MFVSQLAIWMLHGVLIDRDAEFFIQPIDSPAQSTADSAGANVSGEAAVKSPPASREHDSWQRYRVTQACLPKCIPLRIASKALFVGKAALVLKSLGSPKHHQSSN